MPKSVKLIRLDFGRTSTHFGETGIGLENTSERVHSDTLFSAWVSTYARLFQQRADNNKLPIEVLLEAFTTQEVPPFRLSSTFVYRRDNEDFVEYLPTPIQRPLNYPEEPEKALAIAKNFQKIHYLPLSVWQRWYQGEGFNDDDYNAIVAHAANPSHKLNELGKAGTFDYNSAFHRYELPKVSIDRTSYASNFYHTGLTQFGWQSANESPDRQDKRAGLYFLIEFSDTNTALENELKAALHFLGEEGIGGERSSGAGQFEVLSWDTLSPEWQSVVSFDSDRHSLISLYWERSVPDALLQDEACYTLIERGGWIASPFSGRQLRRRKVHMFAEGSVFTGMPNGQLANVTPPEFEVSPGVYRPHPIYRSGVSLSLPVIAEPIKAGSPKAA